MERIPGRATSALRTVGGRRQVVAKWRFLSILPVAWLGVAGLGIAAPMQPESPPTDVMGFAATSFTYASGPENSDACPTGKPATAADIYLETRPPAERAERTKAQNLEALYEDAGRTRDGKEICMDPSIAPDPGFTTVQGGWAPGLNLDGTSDGHATPMSCSHQKFAGADGQAGIDNEFYRVVGCVPGYHAKGLVEVFFGAALRSGELTILFEIKGAKDRLNASNVEVGIYTGSTAAPYSSNGTPLPNGSISVHPNAAFRTVAHGKIVNGVLTTEPADVRLLAPQAYATDYFLKSARLRLELLPDGGARGILAGYQDIDYLFKNQFRYRDKRGNDKGGAISSVMGYSCQGVHYALKRHADGYPDPKTGQCTAISSAFKFEAVPAFLVHTEEEAPARQQAAAADSKTARPRR